MALNEKVFEGHHISLNVGTTVKSGDPIIYGTLVGVAEINADAVTGVATCDLHGGVYALSVGGINAGGNVAVSSGDVIYFTNSDTPKLNKRATGVPYGVAIGTAANPNPASGVQLIASGGTGTLLIKMFTT